MRKINVKNIRNRVQEFDAIPEYKLLIVDLCLAGFVGLAHGGSLAIALTNEPELLNDVLPLARISLPLAAIVLISSIVGIIWNRQRSIILSIHAIILFAGGSAALLWSVSILIHGLPEGSFAWSPGMLTFLCVYPIYLLRRTLLRSFLQSVLVKYIHVLILVIVLVVDVGVFFKALTRFSAP